MVVRWQDTVVFGVLGFDGEGGGRRICQFGGEGGRHRGQKEESGLHFLCVFLFFFFFSILMTCTRKELSKFWNKESREYGFIKEWKKKEKEKRIRCLQERKRRKDGCYK